MSAFFRFLILAMPFTILTTTCNRDDDSSSGFEITETHPKLLLNEEVEAAIRVNIEQDPIWKELHHAILRECNDILGEEPVERVMVGRRLLSTSRRCLKRVFYLSYAYRMTGIEKFLIRAEEEMLAAARFSDWNPSHFLDVAEMTMALAIGYDWLYDHLPEDARLTIRKAIVEKGLNPSFNSSYNGFTRSTNNWNQVCNAGMTYGALAVADVYPELAQRTIDRAVETVPLSMAAYEPDGAYPEGYGYWRYGTTTNVMLLSALEHAFGTDYNLAQIPGFLKTAEFLEHMTGTTNLCFNWGDNNLAGSLNPAVFWFAQKNQDPSLLWVEHQYLQESNYSQFTGNRLLPAVFIWGKDLRFDDIPEPDKTVWMGQGPNPVCLMRTSWTDPTAIYLGFKAGSPDVSHGHMDIGSFVMEAEGVRWASDLGAQNYESLESKGMKIFGRAQDAQRWTIFRMNNYSHNTLTINGELQRVSGYAKIDRYSDEPNFAFAVSDISTVYDGQLAKANRGVAIREQQYVVIRDEVKTLNQPTSLRWSMVTEALVNLGDREATLIKNGKTLYLKVEGPSSLQMGTWSTAPNNDYDAQNPGTVMVGFECELPAEAEATFEVLLVPQRASGIADFTDESLSEW